MKNPDDDFSQPEGEMLKAMNGQGGGPRVAKLRPAAHAPSPAALSMMPSVPALLMALRRRWLLALTLALVCAPAAAFVGWTLRPITFTAKSTLLVKSVPEKVL